MSVGLFLFILFLVLKLTGVIAWSWLWVTCPLWIGLVFTLAFWAVAAAIGGTVVGVAGLFGRRRRRSTSFR